MRKYLASIFLFVVLLLPSVCQASVTCSTDKHSAEAMINKDKIKLGETAQIVVKSDDKYQVEYKIAPKDFANISNDGLVKTLKDGLIKINITINFLKENDDIDDSCKLSIPLEILSHDSSLKKLTLEELDISSMFKQNKLSYEINVPYKFDQINIIAEANSGSAKITGAGKRYLNEGINDYNIVVTASDGTSTTYKITINRENASDDASLKNLIVEGFVLNPNFKSNIYEYNLDVSKEVEEITIKGEPTYEYAKIYGIGTFRLATGLNTYYIKVIAENGNEVKYVININKNLGSSKLTSLSVENYNLDFNSDTYIYNLKVNSDINSLNINAIASDNDQVEIVGNDNLKEGQNEILIRVTGNDKTTTTYKILVNKLSKEKEIIIKKNNILTKVLLVIFILSIILMASLIFIFIKRNYKRKNIYKLKKSKKKNKIK